MNLTWKITKRRGNFRPVLTYSVELEDYEKELALPPLRVASGIPEPVDSWKEFCYPGELERGASAEPKGFYDLEAPSHKGRSWPQALRLPWREDNAYPEVEDSFMRFRDAFEAMLKSAAASGPMDEEHVLKASREGKAAVAPAVAAERFLRMAGRMKEAG